MQDQIDGAIAIVHGRLQVDFEEAYFEVSLKMMPYTQELMTQAQIDVVRQNLKVRATRLVQDKFVRLLAGSALQA